MHESLREETEKLTRSWEQYDRSFLARYLVAGVEDPRGNIQSILSRHFLIDELFPGEFAALRDHELRFGLAMNWLLKLLRTGSDAEEFEAIAYALRQGADNAEGRPIPAWISATLQMLPAAVDGVVVPNYLPEALLSASFDPPRPALSEGSLSTFERLWQTVLAPRQSPPLAVLEPACGSANDYRFLAAFGLARLIDYTGFDLSEKNIANARQLHPQSRFHVANVFDELPAGRVDCIIVHDLFEHLSLPAFEKAIENLCLTGTRSICAHFFNMSEATEHQVQPMDDYHWNRLSRPRTEALFDRFGFRCDAVHLDSFLTWEYHCSETHNKEAWTLFARRHHPS